MNFETQIQNWVNLDNQIRLYNGKVKELREKRNKLEEQLIEQATNNNLSQIKITDGKLKITNTKIPTPLTFKYLEKSLSEVIKNNDQINIILNHLKNGREYKYVQEIKRFSN
jgi:seryl-tRNA synthetase